jgi:small conductance mechanosensitive channel
VIIVVIAFILNRFIIQKSINKFGEKTSLDAQHLNPLRKIASSIVWIVALFIILSVFGFKDIFWGIFAAAGFAGIVVGMATRDVISDIVTGLLLLIYRPFKIGDSVAIDNIDGKVTDVGISGVKLQAWSGEQVIIPNSKVRTAIIQNFTIDSRRATITFYIDYNSDFTQTLKICNTIVENMSEAMKNPKPIIRVDDFTETSVKILLLVWFPIHHFVSGSTKIKRKLANEFEKRGIQVPIIRREEQITKIS